MKSDPQRLKAIREARGHTCVSLADAAGVHERLIRAYEHEPRSLRPTTAKKVADALGVETWDITDATPIDQLAPVEPR